MGGDITVITSKSDFDAVERKAGPSKLIVIDFHAVWCGPCKVIAPFYEELSHKYTSVKFLKCDVDQARDVAAKFSISAMPTFIFYKNGQTLQTIRGANKSALEAAVQRHSGESSSSHNWGTGNTLAGGSPSSGQQATQGIDGNLMLGLALVACYMIYVFLK